MGSGGSGLVIPTLTTLIVNYDLALSRLELDFVRPGLVAVAAIMFTKLVEGGLEPQRLEGMSQFEFDNEVDKNNYPKQK
jgi:hypothetical protein